MTATIIPFPGLGKRSQPVPVETPLEPVQAPTLGSPGVSQGHPKSFDEAPIIPDSWRHQTIGTAAVKWIGPWRVGQL